MPVSVPLADRFWSKVDKNGPNGCWLWTASTVDGYGQISGGPTCRRPLRAHRLAYEWLVGPIPDGLVIDHLCRVRRCVNPSHLQPVTNTENVLRGIGFCARNASATHCIAGHELTPENTYMCTRRQGGRVCRECCRIRDRARRPAA